MISLVSLWLPILLSAAFVFVVSAVLHMAVPWHKSDYRKAPNESAVMDALRPFTIPPGDYMMPACDSPSDMKSPEFAAKMERGPIMIFTVLPNGKFSMGKNLAQWFVYLLIVSAIAAYLATKTVPAGATYHRVFGVVGVAAFLGYAVALWQQSIWYSRSWLTTFKYTVDGAIFAALTAGTFGWLWPR